ncbi:hypothetical protein [Azospirillum sp.]|uniref:hypothetical protein n=1 Tax=Azospirillum sp. TaxID=34012 RepID=UPI00261B63BE|nr:hypothetical protein [Azospirillum sp.]
MVETFSTQFDSERTNWSVARRIVADFAPNAQPTPDMTVMINPGHLLNGVTLVEKGIQTVGPVAAASSAVRIDRVVVDRLTGAALVVTGTEGSLTPPAIPTGKLPVARIQLAPTTTAITNELIIDERSLADAGATASPSILATATLGGADQTGIANLTVTKINFNTAPVNVGSGFDTTNKWFKPSVAGYYFIHANLVYVPSGGGNNFGQAIIQLNGASVAVSTAFGPPAGNSPVTPSVSHLLYLNGTTDRVEICAYLNAATGVVSGDVTSTRFNAHRVV